VRAALGEGAARGLAWHCSRARELLPQLLRLATSANVVLKDHPAQLRAIPVGSDNAVAALKALSDGAQAGVARQLESEDHQQMRTDLREIEQGLPHAFGSYTTLRQISGEAGEKSAALLALALRMRGNADSTEALIKQYLSERDIIRETLGKIDPEYAAEVALRDSILQSWSGSRLPGLKSEPFGIAKSAVFYADQWQPIAEQAQSGVAQAMHPFDQALAACGDWQQPPREFAEARAAAGRPLTEQFIRIDEAYAARAAEIQQSRNKAEEVSRISQETVADLDRRIGIVKTRGQQVTPEDAAGQEKLRALLEKGNKLRSEVLQEVGRMERAKAMLGIERRAVDEQRAAISGMKAKLLAPFNLAGDPAGE